MLFNSFEFILFLPIVFAGYWLLKNHLRWQNAFVVAASYVFYGWWDWRFLILIAITTFFSYLSGIGLERCEDNEKQRKWISAGNIILNLCILGFFKYFNFFGESFASMLQMIGIEASWTTLKIILPIGISFYTFQALSYTIDVYKKKLEPTHDIVAFFAFISFFPQLVAGPIERATNLLPQFLQRREFEYEQGTDGMRQILWGFFKKLVVADNCAYMVNNVWNNFDNTNSITLILAAILFTVQIYCDFSGYSDIAIGTAKLFGIKLMRNFNNPYFSRDIAEFWRRWHISLTTWFRDYIYIPLGGSRTTKAKVIRNTFIIFLVSGFWHGANWTFVAWGAYHALLFVPLLLLGKNRKYQDIVACGRILPNFKELFQIGVTFILAVFGWILFRAESIGDAFRFVGCMFTNGMNGSGSNTDPMILVMVAVMFIVEWFTRKKSHGLEISTINPWLRRLSYLAILFSILMYCGQEQEFIYFQF